jgi:hypothetical protein
LNRKLRLQVIDALFKRRFHIQFERDALREIGLGLGRLYASQPQHPTAGDCRTWGATFLQHAPILEVLRRRFAPNSR